MNVILISTYELGRQPFGLASPAAWLREAGAKVVCLDLSRSVLDEDSIRSANLVAFYVPMHTATRLAALLVGRVRGLNPRAHLCFFGLYASINETYLRQLGADSVLGGEFEEGLLALVKRLEAASGSATRSQPEPVVSTSRQRFRLPDRSDLPALDAYARMQLGSGRESIIGYTEASRGCKHLCRHCPIVPVYEGRFRIVQRDIVLEDIRQQIDAGAAHITFGDPDFFNGVGHSLAVVEALHRDHPRVTYDVTIKIEHLLKHSGALKTLRDTGCILVTSAVESIDDRVLRLLDKGHTKEDFVSATQLLRKLSLNLAPTFVTFTPWTTLEGYLDLILLLADLDLVENVSPIQLGIRLLIPAGSKLLELAEVRRRIGPFSERELSYEWRHDDFRVEALYRDVLQIVSDEPAAWESRSQIFARIFDVAVRVTDDRATTSFRFEPLPARATIPYINEPWFC